MLSADQIGAERSSFHYSKRDAVIAGSPVDRRSPYDGLIQTSAAPFLKSVEP